MWWVRHYSFSSPEPVVSWSRGRETRGSGSSRYRMSENFWHPLAHVQKLQISLLMLITNFCPSPLHWGENFTSWALSREWLFWDVLKMHHFTQLGSTDNLENLKKTVTETGWTYCWFAELRQLIGRLSSEFFWVFFFSIRLANKHWESNIAKIDIMRGKVNLKRYVLSESNSSSELEPQFPNPNHKTSFGVYGGHSVFC